MPPPPAERGRGGQGTARPSVREVGEDLGDWPLPVLDEAASKLGRGTVLIIGGTTETPGAVLLAGVGALRAGAGRLQIATAAPAAPALAAAVPESRVIGLATTAGEVQAAAVEQIADAIGSADAVLVGSGGLDPGRAALLAAAVLDHVSSDAQVLLDAAALAMASQMPQRFAPVADRAALMPNPTEAGHLLGVDATEVERHPLEAVGRLVDTFSSAVALRMADTYSAAPGTAVYRDRCGHPALATSGSGDVLAGIVVGLLAQQADPLTALIRGVHAHGLAGQAVAERRGGYGILAREILDEIPRALRDAQHS